MQFRRVHLVSIGPPGSYDQISFFARSPHCNYNVKLQSSGRIYGKIEGEKNKDLSYLVPPPHGCKNVVYKWRVQPLVGQIECSCIVIDRQGKAITGLD